MYFLFIEQNQVKMSEQIILLDLNKTLAVEIGLTLPSFTYDVSKDVYSVVLVEKIRGRRIFLITARTDNYAEETKRRIITETGLGIERFYFKPLSIKKTPVHFFKRDVVLSLFDEGFKSSDFFGLESNSRTRSEYAKLGIKSVPRDVFLKGDYDKTETKNQAIGTG
jgi:hypothetical protein